MGEDDEGWFDVQAYSTRERWVGPDLHDHGVDGFKRLEDAVQAAHSHGFSSYYEVVVVAYSKHAEHERGETVFKLRGRPTEAGYNSASVGAAEKSLEAHRSALMLEGDDAIQLWQLLVSLREWAAASGVDFDEELRSVDEAVAKGEVSVPAAITEMKRKKLDSESKSSMATRGGQKWVM